MRVVGVDPGAHNGVAIFDTETGIWYADQMMLRSTEAGKWRLDQSEMEDWLDRLTNVGLIVVEDFIQRPRSMRGRDGKRIASNDQWIEQYTAKVVGACSQTAKRLSARYVQQQPTILPAAYAWLGWEYPKDKHHIRDAMAHAYYWTRKHGLVERGFRGNTVKGVLGRSTD